MKRELAFAALLVAATPVLTQPVFAESAATKAAMADTTGPKLVIDVAGQAKGEIVIQLLPKLAPKTVAQIVKLAQSGAYNDVVFHRVIKDFMAQTGDVEYGKKNGGQLAMAGMGGSKLPNVPAEFSDADFARGTVGMARAQDPNSGNSQFFIMFKQGSFLDGKYTLFGKVIKGMDVVDKIKLGDGPNGVVTKDPDVMTKVTVEK